MSTKKTFKVSPWQVPELTIKSFIFNIFITFTFNSIIALFLHFFSKFSLSFASLFALSQCIGLSICLLIRLLFHFLQPEKLHATLLLLFSCILLGSLTGFTVWSLLSGNSFPDPGQNFLANGGKTILLGLFFGIIIAYFFISRDRITRTEKQAQDERLHRLTLEKQAAETELKLLQAQIEPHFLFNTLSTLLSLLETDIKGSKKMLEDLLQFLRSSLNVTRQESITLRHELELVHAYLSIYKIRMGERLNFDITLPEKLQDTPFFPMLIQPLVENAITHGLEPNIRGGNISIAVSKLQNTLKITVSDTGLGITENFGKGLGLKNIQERLASLYGKKGKLTLKENQKAGLSATIEVECD